MINLRHSSITDASNVNDQCERLFDCSEAEILVSSRIQRRQNEGKDCI